MMQAAVFDLSSQSFAILWRLLVGQGGVSAFLKKENSILFFWKRRRRRVDSLCCRWSLSKGGLLTRAPISPVEAGAAGAYGPVAAYQEKHFPKKRRSCSFDISVCNAYGKEGK